MNEALFIDREDAGVRLGHLLLDQNPESPYIWAIPAGGVPVGKKVSEILHGLFDLIVVRKLRIPDNPEAGFGAVATDGEVAFNQRLLRALGLTDDKIRQAETTARAEIRQRETLFRQDKPYPRLQKYTAIVVDDGFASGYTAVAAVRFLRKLAPKKIWAAAPVVSANAASLLKTEVERLVTLHISYETYFAVASFYKNWWDLSDAEVLDYLEKRKDQARQT